jgi:hypothetical protein
MRPEPPLREPDDYEGVAADLAEFGVVFIREEPDLHIVKSEN